MTCASHFFQWRLQFDINVDKYTYTNYPIETANSNQVLVEASEIIINRDAPNFGEDLSFFDTTAKLRYNVFLLIFIARC